MAYVPPGSTQSEVILPASTSANSLALSVGLIGIGAATKQSVNEALIRGKIYAEAVAFSGTPKVDTLASRAMRRASTTTLLANGTAMASSDWQFNAASITSDATSTVDLTTRNVFALSLDGRTTIQIYFTAAPSTPAALKANTTNGVVVPRGATTNATTMAEMATNINLALAYMDSTQTGLSAAQSYGTAYSTVATTSGGKLVITSPGATAASDVAIYAGYPASANILGGTLAFSNSTIVALDGGRHAKTVIQLIATYSDTTTYTINYIGLDQNTDPVNKTPLVSFSRVGNFPNITSFFLTTDYTKSSNNISWASTNYTFGALTSVAGTFDVHTNDVITLSLDGKAAIDVHLGTNASAPPQWVAPSVLATATATELALNINATLTASAVYGPFYSTVATVSGGTKVVITTPTPGQAGVVSLMPSTSLYAGQIVFGVAANQLGGDATDSRGIGNRPAWANTYYATYNYTRPSGDYNLPKQFFSQDTAFADIGTPTATNPLAMGVSLAFKNGAPAVFVCQVDDSAIPGLASQGAFDAAINACEGKSEMTELVVLDTRSSLMVDLYNAVTSFNGPSIQHFCRGWYGMVRNTAVGDSETSGTFVYTAVVTLGVPADSPSRGRHILVAPAQGDVELTLADGSSQVVTLDGPFLAAAVAGRFASRGQLSDTLINKTIVGFTNVADDPTTDTFPTYKKAENALLASHGVTVITERGGKLVLTDPMTTEGGGGGLVEFEEIQASCCKDDVVVAVNNAVNANLVGLVPTDLADFILTIKSQLATVLRSKVGNGVIGPYRDGSGRARDISLSLDMQVFQSATDPRNYLFNYYFNLRYPALRFSGQFSVDSAFFTS